MDTSGIGLTARVLLLLAFTTPAVAAPHPVPGRVEAEGFSVFTPTSGGKDGFGPYGNLQACQEGTLNVGWVADGEAFGYDISASLAGTYALTVRAASAGTGAFHISLDGIHHAQTNAVTTGGWQSWRSYVIENVSLSAGAHHLQVIADVGGFNLNYLDVVLSTPPVSAIAVPGRMEAERYTSFVGDSSWKGGYGPDRNLEACAEGSENVGWIADGEVFGYEVNTSVSGTYTASVRTASPLTGQFHLVVDGATGTGMYSASTGGWQNWVTVAIPGVYLASGLHRIQLVVDRGGLNFNYVDWTPESVHHGSVEVFLTTGDQVNRLARQTPVPFSQITDNPLTVIVNPNLRYQQMDGFGASLTDSSAWLVSRMPLAQRTDLMRRLFDRDSGIGLSVLRLPMGASDFALANYTYDDVPSGSSDLTLSHFSIAHDVPYIIPVLRESRRINPQLSVIATPWTAPAWMKTNRSLTGGGTLIDSSSVYAAYARYFVRFIQSYRDAGIPIFAVTPQNEPLNAAGYASMTLQWWEEFNFVRYHLGPAFEAAGIDTKIFVLDHNWSDVGYAELVLGNGPEVLHYASGAAFHCYAGEPSEMDTLYRMFPDKDIHLTECSGWGDDTFAGNIQWLAEKLLIEGTRHGSKTILRWNLVLDENHGPHVPAGCSDCRGMVTVNAGDGSLAFMDDYYSLGHASKFVRPGAYRIESTTFSSGSIQDVAFRNPDGSRVLIVLNSSAMTETFQVREGSTAFSYTLPAGALATMIWR